MARLLVCQHVPYEPLGILLPLIKSCGHRVRYVNFSRSPELKISPTSYDALVILGSPQHANDTEQFPYIQHEIDLIQQTIAQKKPFLGICFGAQLLAKALGAKVYKNQEKEIGWYPVAFHPEAKNSIFCDFKDSEMIFEWHGDTFTLPEGAVALAGSKHCPQQAFSFGETVYGMQFHLEVDEKIIERWVTLPEHKRQFLCGDMPCSPEQIYEQTPLHINRLKMLGTKAFLKWLSFIEPVKKNIQLSSR